MKTTGAIQTSSPAAVTPPAEGITRRDFFKRLGGGILILAHPWPSADLEAAARISTDFNAFLHIAEDGTVTCFTGKIEMGQGIITGLAMQMADELNVPYEKVKMVMGDTDLCPWDGGTWGSQTIMAFGPLMRAAAAEAKGVLLELGSQHLQIPVSRLEARDGKIIDAKDPQHSVTYGQLTRGKKIEKHLETKPPLEDHTQFTYAGKPFKRSDSRQKVTGEAKYAGDLKLPGMLHARILRPPSLGAQLTSADVSEAEKVEGVEVVRDGDLVAVLSASRDKADEAIEKIKADYSFDKSDVTDRTICEKMLKSKTSARVVKSAGDLEEGRRLSDEVFESEFSDPFLAHAPIETHSALAHFEGDKLTVWASTQTPFRLRDSLSRALDLPPDKVRVIVPFVGGAFGGKSTNNDQAMEAARLAKLSGKPVLVIWTREEESVYDHFHTAGVVTIKSGMDKTGLIRFWDYHVYYSGTRGADAIYDVPHAKITSYTGDRRAGPPVHLLATGPWRAPNNNTNTFARESQIDIMASKAGIDPLEFRLKNLKDQKMINCLKAVADKFGYVPGKTPSGRGIGIACGADANTWVAFMAEVKVNKNTGKVRVLRVACAQDMGLCANPQGALIQMEGCITMGLGYTLSEEVKFEGGNVLDRGFDTYEIPRFSWVPKIDCVILDRMDQPPTGGGEPAIIGIGAVVANGIFDATGARLYRMPMTSARVLEALQKV